MVVFFRNAFSKFDHRFKTISLVRDFLSRISTALIFQQWFTSAMALNYFLRHIRWMSDKNSCWLSFVRPDTILIFDDVFKCSFVKINVSVVSVSVKISFTKHETKLNSVMYCVAFIPFYHRINIRRFFKWFTYTFFIRKKNVITR